MSETERMTLTEFLLARIAEDEQSARDRLGWPKSVRGFEGPLRKQVAECEAKRRIVELHRESKTLYDENNGLAGVCAHESSWEYFTDGRGSSKQFPCETIRLIALPYADHPDYREEWRV